MNFHFFKYFTTYIFKAKTRQGLLFIAIFGLLLSSFSLVAIQGVMGGLQSGLIARSKNVVGSHEVFIRNGLFDKELVDELLAKLKQSNINFHPEYEIELLLKNEDYTYPVIVHGVDLKQRPHFLSKKDLQGVVLGGDLASQLNAFSTSVIEFISPMHTNSLLGEIPRHSINSVSDFFLSQLPEVDSVSAWVDIRFIQNLIRKREINKILIYATDDNKNKISSILSGLSKDIFMVRTWEDKNKSLVWALNLETSVMLFLFICMSFLVAISITSGFMIFFSKIMPDLISFWILGKSQSSIYKLSLRFASILSFTFCITGTLGGVIFLLLLKNQDLAMLPSFFVEQSIPVKFSAKSLIISFVVPFFVANLFAMLSFNVFKRENHSFISLIRKVGN